MRDSGQGRAIYIFSVCLLVLLAPLLFLHFEILWSRSHYQWFPLLILVVVGWLMALWRKGEAPATRPSARILAWGLVVCSVLTVVALLYLSGWVAMVAAIFVVGVILAQLTSVRQMSGVFGVWALLFLLVRLPNQLELRLLTLFENISAKVASLIIDQTGVFQAVQGHLLVINDKQIDIKLICNSFFSVVGVVVLASLFCVWRKRPLFHTVLMLVLAIAVGVAVNVLRVATVGIIFGKHGWDLMDSGWFYVMQVVSYVLAALALVSCDALVGFFFTPVEADEHKKDGKVLVKLWSWMVDFSPAQALSYLRKPQREASRQLGRGTIVFFSVLLIGLSVFEAPILYYRWGFGDHRTSFMHDKSTLAVIDPTEVVFNRPGWSVLDIKSEERELSSIWGAYSFVWSLKFHDTVVVMALDYPFDKWHDVKVCYTKLGWKVEAENLLEKPSYQGWGASQTEMTTATGDFGFILCSHCDHLGGIVTPKPTDHQLGAVAYYLHPKQWAAPYGVSVDKDKNTFYQTQMMVTSPFPLNEATKEELREMYGEFRAQTRKLIQQKSKK